jgi:hypothetical protein
MTCIVGYIDRQNKKIYMGGDSASVGGNTLRIRKDPKVFIRSLYSSSGNITDRIYGALQCAEHYSAGVRGPFNIIEMGY